MLSVSKNDSEELATAWNKMFNHPGKPTNSNNKPNFPEIEAH
jgi:hypothetical protein